MADKPPTLTPLRLRALRLIQQRPGLRASALAHDLVEGRDGWTRFERARTGAQAATRWGAAYARPMIAAGWVRAQACRPGWAALYLTALGERIARTGTVRHEPKEGD